MRETSAAEIMQRVFFLTVLSRLEHQYGLEVGFAGVENALIRETLGEEER